MTTDETDRTNDPVDAEDEQFDDDATDIEEPDPAFPDEMSDDDEEDEDESVLLTETEPGSVLPPEDTEDTDVAEIDAEDVEPADTDIETETEDVEPAEAVATPLERLEPVGADRQVDSGAGGYHERLSVIQAAFIDDPRRAAESASALVGEMWHDIERTVAEERNAMDSHWQASDASTDDLRAVMQSYRALFTRLTDFTSTDPG